VCQHGDVEVLEVGWRTANRRFAASQRDCLAAIARLLAGSTTGALPRRRPRSRRLPQLFGRRSNSVGRFPRHIRPYTPMRSLHAALLALSSACLCSARLLYSGPEDLYAFPKSRVTFLNNFPVSNETAQHWLAQGLKGGEREFMGEDRSWYPQSSLKQISSSELGSPVCKPVTYTTTNLSSSPSNF